MRLNQQVYYMYAYCVLCAWSTPLNPMVRKDLDKSRKHSTHHANVMLEVETVSLLAASAQCISFICCDVSGKVTKFKKEERLVSNALLYILASRGIPFV